MTTTNRSRAERGTILLIVLFIATAIAGLAAISSGRVVAESRRQAVLEDETRALGDAIGRIHFAMNVVNNSAYDDQNHNLVIRAAVDSPVAHLPEEPEWMVDPDGVQHGLIAGTEVRVYRAREYVSRLAKLKNEPIEEVDPLGESDSYFVLEALGRSRDTDRLVSALVRENEPFSSFVFFQNQHLLGISGEPRGLIHANRDIAFYFPKGRYVDTVSAVDGFEYRSGATPENTLLADANPNAAAINLENVDFEELRSLAETYMGEDGLDAEIKFFGDGRVRITPYTPPRYELEEYEEIKTVITGYETVTYTVTESVQVGTVEEERTREIIVGYETETYTVTVPVFEDQEVEKTRWIPIYELQLVTKTRWIKVFVPFDGDGDLGGGTTVGDSGEGVLGEYVWIEEEYQVEENVIIRWEEETYTVVEAVQVGTVEEERTRDVPIRETETYTVEVPVYEDQEREVTEEVPITKEIVKIKEHWVYRPPVPLGYDHVWANDDPATIYIDGRITQVDGDLNGRLTIVGNEKVRITGDITYVDDSGETAMLNGNSTTEAYQRNPEYTGNSVLGIIARSDVLFTWNMADKAEVNGTLMSVHGRVGTDGIWIDADGNPVKDSWWARKTLLTDEEQAIEANYDKSGTYRTRTFVKDSLRRLGGIISNNRIIETYIQSRKDGTAYVDAGFKRGAMRYDFNVNFNPPPNFVEIPRPVLSYMMPVFLVRDET